MANNYPFKKGDIQEFLYHGDRLKRTIDDIREDQSHLVVISSFESVPKDYVFPTNETVQAVEEKKKTWIQKVKGWFN
jgi:hypothetical protein